MSTAPSQYQPQVGVFSIAESTKSTKRKKPQLMDQQSHTVAKRQKATTAGKRFKPPMTRSSLVTPITKSPMLRLVASTTVIGTRSSADNQQSSLSPVAMPETSPSPSNEETTDLDSQDLCTTTSLRSKPRKLRSAIWKEMQPIYENGKLVQGKCPHCLEIFPAARNSGTSHMRRHLLVCEPRAKMHEIAGKLQASVVSTESAAQTNWKYDPSVTRKELVRLIVLHELPFSFVEYEGFRSYSASLNPLCEPISITAIKENCMEAYKNHRLTLRDILGKCKCKISLTADVFTSNGNETMGYICITAHYIDSEWKVQKRTIRFCTAETPHDAFNIYSVILKSIRYYNIEDKLFSITLNDAPVNKTMMDLLVANLLSKNMLLCGGNLFHVRCASHVLNLIVKDGLQAIDGVINDVRESVKYIEGSESMKEKFEEIIGQLGISCQHRPSLDVATCWNSTFDMLESALPLKDAFYQLGRQDPNYKHSPSTEEWARTDVVCNLLRVFKAAIEVVSGLTYPTSNLYFHHIWNVRQVLDDETSSSNPTVVTLVKGMKTEFEKFWEISYLTYSIPVILDPRFKFGFIEFRLNQAFQEFGGYHIAKVDEALRSLFAGYSFQVRDTANHFAQGNGTAAALKGKPWSDWTYHINTQKNQVINELDRYLQDNLFPCDDDDFDVLHWWKMHSSKYPTLARMACDVLAFPASTVPPESAFSTSGHITNDYRTRLSGNTAEALICFQDWIRAAGSSYLDIISVDNLDNNLDDFYL